MDKIQDKDWKGWGRGNFFGDTDAGKHHCSSVELPPTQPDQSRQVPNLYSPLICLTPYTPPWWFLETLPHPTGPAALASSSSSSTQAVCLFSCCGCSPNVSKFHKSQTSSCCPQYALELLLSGLKPNTSCDQSELAL